MTTPASTWAVRLVGSNARFCLTLIPFLAVGPLAYLCSPCGRGTDAAWSRWGRGGIGRQRHRCDVLCRELRGR